jgi:hypothetical protein
LNSFLFLESPFPGNGSVNRINNYLQLYQKGR